VSEVAFEVRRHWTVIHVSPHVELKGEVTVATGPWRY
jgi:hypothetical protein